MKSFLFVLAALCILPMNAAAASPLLVTLDTTLTGSIPRGASRVPLATLTFEAPCDEDVNIQQLTVTHTGLGNSDDIERVYVMSGNRRITRARGFTGREKTAALRLSNFSIPQCTSDTLTIMGDFSSTAESGGEHRVDIKSAADIVSSASSIQITHKGTRSSVRTTPADAGAINVEILPVRTSVLYGNNRVVGRFNFEADGNANHSITAITFTNTGKARDMDLKNLRLEKANGTQIGGTLSNLTGDKARFIFTTPFILENNQTVLLEIHADVRASRRKTIGFTVEEPSDVEAVVAKQRR